MTEHGIGAVLETGPGRPLAVEADLTVTVGGEAFTVRSGDAADRVLLTAPSLRSLLRLRRRAGDAALRALDRAELTVVVRVGDRTVGVAGAGADPGGLEELLGLVSVELRLGGALRSLLD